MKQNSLQEPATKQDLLDLKVSTKQDLNNLREELLNQVEKKGAEFRDDILTRLDDVMGQLENLREDKELATHQTRALRDNVDDHEKRIKKVEKVIHTA